KKHCASQQVPTNRHRTITMTMGDLVLAIARQARQLACADASNPDLGAALLPTVQPTALCREGSSSVAFGGACFDAARERASGLIRYRVRTAILQAAGHRAR